MKLNIEITNEERRMLLRWALLTDRPDAWSERGVFRSSVVAAYIFRLGLEAAKKDLS